MSVVALYLGVNPVAAALNVTPNSLVRVLQKPFGVYIVEDWPLYVR